MKKYNFFNENCLYYEHETETFYNAFEAYNIAKKKYNFSDMSNTQLSDMWHYFTKYGKDEIVIVLNNLIAHNKELEEDIDYLTK